MTVQYASLTAEFVDGALYFYDSAHTTVLIVSSTGFDLRGGTNLISSASLVNAPTISTPNISTATLTGTTVISTATITNSTISSASLTGNVTMSTGGFLMGAGSATVSSANMVGTTVISTAVFVGTITSSTNGILSSPQISGGSLSVANISTPTLTGSVTVSSGLTLDGVNSETIAINTTVVEGKSGRIYNCATDAVYLDLVAASTNVPGITFWLRNTGAAGAAQLTIRTTTLGAIIGGGISTSEVISNTKATAKKGDYIGVVNTGSTSWRVIGMVGTWASTT